MSGINFRFYIGIWKAFQDRIFFSFSSQMAKSSELQAAGRTQSAASVLHPSNNQTGVGTRYEVSKHTPNSRWSLAQVVISLII